MFVLKKNKLQILDGQHRFYICKKLRRQVHYIIVKDNKTIADIARVNSNVEKWNPLNFVNCYITQGIKDYQKLKDFFEKYGIDLGTCINMLMRGNPKATGHRDKIKIDFENGSFKINFLKEATELADDAKRFEASGLSRSRDFILALSKVKEAGLVTIDTLSMAFEKNQDMLVKQVSSKKYIYNLEELASKGKHKRVVII